MCKEILIAANTPHGFVSHFDKYLDCDKVICLKGGSGVGKSTLLRQIIAIADALDYHITAMPCSSDYKSLDMVVVKEISAVILDSTAPHIIEPMAYGIKGEIFNLGDCLDKKKLREHKQELTKLFEEKSIIYSSLYNYLNIASHHIANVDLYYCEQLDKNINSVTAKIIKEHLCDCHAGEDSLPRFADYLETTGIIDNTCQYVNGRKVVKVDSPSQRLGRKVIAKLALYLDGLGVQYEHYYTLMAPNELSGIAVKDIVITSANCPADYVYALGSSDCVGNIRGKLLQIIEDRNSSQNALSRAGDCLAKARALHMEVEKYYIDCMDFNVLEASKSQLFNWIFN